MLLPSVCLFHRFFAPLFSDFFQGSGPGVLIRINCPLLRPQAAGDIIATRKIEAQISKSILSSYMSKVSIFHGAIEAHPTTVESQPNHLWRTHFTLQWSWKVIYAFSCFAVGLHLRRWWTHKPGQHPSFNNQYFALKGPVASVCRQDRRAISHIKLTEFGWLWYPTWTTTKKTEYVSLCGVVCVDLASLDNWTSFHSYYPPHGKNLMKDAQDGE